MTLAEIQAEFDASPCVAALSQGQLLHLIAKLLFGSGSMTLAQIQTLFDESPCLGTLMAGQLTQLFVASGAGGGDVASLGTNYCFSGTAPDQTLKILNLTTSLSNPIYADGNDGEQGIVLNPGEACT